MESENNNNSSAEAQQTSKEKGAREKMEADLAKLLAAMEESKKNRARVAEGSVMEFLVNGNQNH